MDEDGRVSLAYRDLIEIPPNKIAKYAAKAQVLDLTHNQFSDLRSLEDFTSIHTLILDNNNLKSHMKFPSLPNVQTLWANRNRISNLTVFIETLSTYFPNLHYLSMMNNPAAPSFFNGGTYDQYLDYRYYVISQLPQLKMLDDKPIPSSERQEAERMYKHLISTKSSKGRLRSTDKSKEKSSLKKSRRKSENDQSKTKAGQVDLPTVAELSKT